MNIYDQDPTGDNYRLVRCKQCGLEWIEDPVARQDIFKHYPTDNSPYAAELGESIPLVKRFLFWLDARLLLKHLKPGDLVMDVGAGLGTFGSYLRWRGLNVIAADFIDAKKWPRKNIPYVQVDLNAPSLSFDKLKACLGDQIPKAVVIRHVLEHVFEPERLISFLSDLKPQYILVIVPNGGSWLRWLFGKHWGFFDPPRHLSNFRKESLRCLFQRAGYKSFEFNSYGMDETVVSIYRLGRGWSPKIRKWFSWTSKAMLISSALSLLPGRSVLVVLASGRDHNARSSG